MFELAETSCSPGQQVTCAPGVCWRVTRVCCLLQDAHQDHEDSMIEDDSIPVCAVSPAPVLVLESTRTERWIRVLGLNNSDAFCCVQQSLSSVYWRVNSFLVCRWTHVAWCVRFSSSRVLVCRRTERLLLLDNYWDDSEASLASELWLTVKQNKTPSQPLIRPGSYFNSWSESVCV